MTSTRHQVQWFNILAGADTAGLHNLIQKAASYADVQSFVEEFDAPSERWYEVAVEQYTTLSWTGVGRN